jgi:hypothetical protein
VPDPFDIFSGEQGKLHEILTKIIVYQHSLSNGRTVELDELQREGVLSAADIEFMSAHSVTYKAHKGTDYHADDMLHMPTEEGCVFVGPGGPPLIKRRARLAQLQTIVQDFLKIPRPENELLLHIEFSEHNGMGVAPKLICFIFQSDCWRARLPAIRTVAAEFGFHPFQEGIVQIYHQLSFVIPKDTLRTSAAVVALLSRGCGLTDESEVVYSAGALDEAKPTASAP